MSEAVLNPKTVVHETPVKTAGIEVRPKELLEAQAARAIEARVPIDYHVTRGTCGDERRRARLLSGEPRVEPRPSAWGGPDIYGLYVAELTGLFGDEDLSPRQRLQVVKNKNNQAGIKSGGHANCAAALSFGGVMGIIADNPELMSAYAAQNKLDYDQSIMDIVVSQAQKVKRSSRYDGVSMESVYLEVLGDEAGEAIEVLEPGPHEGKTFVRNHGDNTTVDQNRLHDLEHEDSFVQDEGYVDAIENAVTAETDGRQKLIAEHAREAVLAAISMAVPNEELYQIDLA